MAVKSTKRKKGVNGSDFDALAFVHEVVAWYSESGREEIERSMEVVGRDRARLARSLEISPKVMSEAVTF